MRILHVNKYGYIAGGVEKCISLLKEEMNQRGHKTVVLSSNQASRGRSSKSFNDFDFIEIDQPNTGLMGKLVKHLWYVDSYKALREIIGEFKPDIVHFHTTSQASPSVFFALGSTPAVLTIHSPEEYTKSMIEWLLPKSFFKHNRVDRGDYTVLGKFHVFYYDFIQRQFYKKGFRRSLRCFITPSKYMQRTLELEKFNIPIRQIYNGIKLPNPVPLRNHNRLLFVGRLEYEKGVYVLLDALALIIKANPDIQLDVVGDGSLRQDLQKYCKKSGISTNVSFYGWLDGQSMREKYINSTIVCVPSIWPEALGIVCLEALAYGRPVIGSDQGGIPEIIEDDITGKIVPNGNAAALAEAIVDFLDPHKLDGIEKLCSSSATRFDAKKYVDAHEDLYKEIVEAKSNA
jgi:glycosyltransferase involved in cell wall biosynthesis